MHYLNILNFLNIINTLENFSTNLVLSVQFPQTERLRTADRRRKIPSCLTAAHYSTAATVLVVAAAACIRDIRAWVSYVAFISHSVFSPHSRAQLGCRTRAFTALRPNWKEKW